MAENDYSSILTDDPESGLLLAQWCVTFTMNNHSAFVRYVSGEIGAPIPPDAFLNDYPVVFSYLELLKQVAQMTTIQLLIGLINHEQEASREAPQSGGKQL